MQTPSTFQFKILDVTDFSLFWVKTLTAVNFLLKYIWRENKFMRLWVLLSEKNIYAFLCFQTDYFKIYWQVKSQKFEWILFRTSSIFYWIKTVQMNRLYIGKDKTIYKIAYRSMESLEGGRICVDRVRENQCHQDRIGREGKEEKAERHYGPV